MDNRPIGVYDSGVGGLSVLIELKKLLPKERFVFLADQKYVPYGEKTKKELVNRGYKITDYFLKSHDIKMMVIACNTATCGGINEFRAKFSDLPIVGTIPAIKPAAEKTKTKTIAVIATPSTSKSEVVKKLIEDNCKGINVINIGCTGLEDTVEKGKVESPAVKKLLKNYLESIIKSDADYLVLGCTHYPFLKKVIAKMMKRPIVLIDSGKAIAKRTSSLLDRYSTRTSNSKNGKDTFVTTGDKEKFSKAASMLLKRPVKAEKVII
ncbi:glutamate racemase [Patescibacteria group bacterium]|nr:glutamate racemase [Patescibacteria group bacterium]